jgi:hypothetical protein
VFFRGEFENVSPERLISAFNSETLPNIKILQPHNGSSFEVQNLFTSEETLAMDGYASRAAYMIKWLHKFQTD